MRKSNEETEQGKACILDLFLSSAKELREIGKKIADYEASCNENDLASFAQKSAGLSKQANDTKDQIETILPKYETVRKALENQERYRKNLRDNIDVISLNQQIEETRKGNVALEEMVAQVDGHETVDDDMENLRSRRESILKMVSRLEGRRGEILESIRSVKVREEFYQNYADWPLLDLMPGPDAYSASCRHRNTRMSMRSTVLQ